MIELVRAQKRYKGKEVSCYVDRLTLNRGEIIGVLGDNGSGKTSFLKMVMGLGRLSNGTVQVDGCPPVEQYSRMAFVTEEGSWLPGMNSQAYGEFLAEFYPRFDPVRYARLLHSFELEANKPIRTLSKGQRAKLELAAGFAKRADYLLLDEPFLGVDGTTRRRFLNELAAELTGDELVLVATHFVEDFANLFDRVLLFHGGRIRVDAAVDELREQGISIEELMTEVSSGERDGTYY
ncbi:ATP-binding cassette domain-containing protein [Gorillibacterium timonense]|uniref:ATP-binding cassette domain-containing protein n=1 Tax=Gorillibacterium timonense TaxID=1689269 RepID=UPI00071CEE37|nr:ABC transporter ATP-binding protein [Gorillibacterium timonense]